MIEHIFRNINDIRIFDIMTEFIGEDSIDDRDLCNIDDIMDMLEYPEYKRIQVEDSVKHLVENEILAIKKIKTEGVTGCKTCKWTDKLKLPRMGEHVKHIPEEISIGDIDKYYMKYNKLIQLLIGAVFAHVTAMVEKDGLVDKENNKQLKI